VCSGCMKLRSAVCLAVCALGGAGLAQDSAVVRPVESLAHYEAIRITEIMYNPRGGTDFEFVELCNTGTNEVDLSGMRFAKGLAYSFPDGTVVGAGGFFVLARNAKAFALRYGRAPDAVYKGTLSNKGETLRLSDGMGQTVERVKYDDRHPWPGAADGDGYSLALDEPREDPNRAQAWAASNKLDGSPGADDGPHARVWITEVLSHSDHPLEDAIELYNAGRVPVDVGGWYLSDDKDVLVKFRLMDGLVLEPGARMVYYESEFNSDPRDPACFALSSHGDQVWLSSASKQGVPTQYRTGVRFGASRRQRSFGRHEASDGKVDFVALTRRTFGVDTPKEVADFRTGLGLPNAEVLIGPIVVNEIMYGPAEGGEEYIELYNTSEVPMPLYDPDRPQNPWILTNAVDYTFPTGVVMEAGGYLLVVHTKPAKFRAKYNVPARIRVLGPYRGMLNNAGESVQIRAPDVPEEDGFIPYYLVDRVRYRDNAPWPCGTDGTGLALEKVFPAAYGNDPVNWIAGAPGGTPGRRNSPVLVGKTAAWRYYERGRLKGDAWRQPQFNDRLWPLGNAPFGYGENTEHATTVSYGGDEAHKFVTAYFRTAFDLHGDPNAIRALQLHFECDAGLVAYLNGTEILRENLPNGKIGCGTLALTAPEPAAGAPRTSVLRDVAALRQGRNLLAVEVHRPNLYGNDLFVDLQLGYLTGNP